MKIKSYLWPSIFRDFNVKENQTISEYIQGKISGLHNKNLPYLL